MASITVTQNCYWGGPEYNWAGLVFGDSITVNSGAVLTVDPIQYTPTNVDLGIRVISTSGFGEVVYDNNGTSALRHYGPAQQTMQARNGSKLTVKKHFLTIYTGDGSASQTTSGWTAAGFDPLDIPAEVQVETGNGTNTYTRFVNIDTLLFSDVGVGELGNWFKYNNTTGVITFGDGGAGTAGHGGNVVPMGARVRVYSTLWGTKSNATTIQNYATAADNYEADFSPGGDIDLSGLYLSGYFLNVNNVKALKTDGVAAYIPVNVTFAGDAEIKNLTVCANASNTTASSATFNVIPNLTIENIITTSISTYSLYLQNLFDGQVKNPRCFVLKRDSVNDASLNLNTCSSVEISDSFIVGCRVYIDTSKNIVFRNIGISDSPHADLYGNYYTSFINNAGDVGATLINIYAIADGHLSDSSIANLITGFSEIYQSSIAAIGTQFCSIPVDGLIIKDAYIGSVSTYHILWSGSKSNIVLQNVRSNSFTLPLFRGAGYTPANVIFKAVDVSPTGIPTNPGWTQNTHFYEVRVATNSGLIGLLFTAYTSDYQYITKSGTVAFNMAGAMYMPGASGDSIVYTWPHRIIGVTGLLGVLTLDGANTQYFTVEYSLDNGNTWAAVTETNMQAETVSPSAGFPLKIRITHTRQSAADYLNLLNFTTSVDYINYKYPIDTYTLTLASQNGNDLVGAQISIYDRNGVIPGDMGDEIAESNNNGYATFQHIHYGVENQVYIQIIKSGYVEQVIPFTLLPENQTVFIGLEVEENE